MVVVLGGGGFVGSAFVRHLARNGIAHRSVGRKEYAERSGSACDVLINAAGNSVKYLADRDPLTDFRQSVETAVAASRDFAPQLYVLLSSVDVYADLARPATTTEDTPLDPLAVSMYGFHKQLAEMAVRRHNQSWLIVRLAGMVGPGLRKNPVFDVLNDQPLRISPDSRYQFMSTDDAAAAVWSLVESGVRNAVFNVCGRGLISPRDIAGIAGRELKVHAEAQDAPPRIVDVSIERIARTHAMPSTRESVAAYIQRHAYR